MTEWLNEASALSLWSPVSLSTFVLSFCTQPPWPSLIPSNLFSSYSPRAFALAAASVRNALPLCPPLDSWDSSFQPSCFYSPHRDFPLNLQELSPSVSYPSLSFCFTALITGSTWLNTSCPHSTLSKKKKQVPWFLFCFNPKNIDGTGLAHNELSTVTDEYIDNGWEMTF